MALGGTLQERIERLNQSMHSALIGRSLIACEMGELDAANHGFQLANAGCPYPYHYRAATGDLVELQVDAYPLGARPDTKYGVIDTQLQPGDRVVFYSDGIPEAENAAEEQFGYERTGDTICQACADGLSAEATIDRLLEAVAAFRGDAPQSDDMTCVVVQVEEA
ncbi:MAG: PP2C family protein-serine/threonine phosphatase [Candidatus Latescibacteria bacterium]|nr:PP2C family protein-serine/threonine phosphatase [Candidatus Latescibacterota bacterium]